MTTVIIVSGYAGSGKTEFAKILSSKTKYGIIDKDTTTRPLVDALLTKLGSDAGDRESDTYQKEIRPLEYQVLEAVLEENIAVGTPLIATAPWIASFEDESFWTEKKALYKTFYGVQLYLVWIRSDLHTMRIRLVSRNAKRDTFKLTNWQRYCETVDIDLGAQVADYVIDNSTCSRPLAEQADSALKDMGINLD